MNTRNLMLGAATILMLSAASPAFAAETNVKANGIINFDALDTDHDGSLTETEFSANSFFKSNRFSDVDKNDDGVINGQELSTWARVQGKGNAVGTSNTTTGVVGTIGVPHLRPNVDTGVTVNGTTSNGGAGAAIGVKGKVSGSDQER